MWGGPDWRKSGGRFHLHIFPMADLAEGRLLKDSFYFRLSTSGVPFSYYRLHSTVIIITYYYLISHNHLCFDSILKIQADSAKF
jgi:hypothetical protein